MDCEVRETCAMEPRIRALEDWKSESKKFHNTFYDWQREQIARDAKLDERDQTVRQELEQRIDQAQQEILTQVGGGAASGTAAVYQEVTLSAGQVLYGTAGCEVMLRSGSASCVSAGKSTPGLVDVTGGATINDGTALQQNHLYTMTADRGVKASGAVTLLVRGSYTIG